MILHNARVHQTDLLFLKIFVSISAKSHLSSFFFDHLTFEKNEILEFFFFFSACLFVFLIIALLVCFDFASLILSDELVLSFVSYLLLCPHTLLH